MLPLLMFGAFFLLIMLGVPIAFAIGGGALVSLLYTGADLNVLVQQTMTILDSFPFLAVPFFLLAGAIMESGGVSLRLIRLANVLVGRFQGGLALVSILGTTIFSDVSGSTTADTAAVGSVTLPGMRRSGYPMDLATAFVAAGGSAAVLIPPCITMVIYGFITETSIAALFLAGFLPGLVMCFATLTGAYVMCWRRGLPAEPPPTRPEALAALVGAVLPLGMPAIILGGIVGGAFTVTEAAAVAVIYGLVITLGARELRLRQLYRIIVESSVVTGTVLIIAVFASQTQWILTVEGIPQTIASGIRTVANSPAAFLILVNILCLVLGCLMDSAAALLLVTPVLFPIARAFHIDPVHFGIVLTANLGIGFITPPVGLSLFVACGISKVPLEQVVRPLLPFVAIQGTVVLLITYWPDFVLMAPARIMGYVAR